jgi:HSP20 family protein
MTGTAHKGGSDKSVDGRVVVFPSTGVTAYDPLRGVPAAELKVRISYATGKHLQEKSIFSYVDLRILVICNQSI